MKKFFWYILMATTFVGGTVSSSLALGDSDEKYEYHWINSRLDARPIINNLYTEECGACHFAYQPGLLPARSWERLMNNLDNHFTENAELSAEVEKQIRDYLISNAVDSSDYRRFRSNLKFTDKDSAPIRITETRYFKHEHHEIPKSIVEANDRVKSFSNCDSCHRDAARGSFDEHRVNIPGWENGVSNATIHF